MLALSQGGFDDLEAADVRQEVTYGLVGTLVVRVRIMGALDGGIARMAAVGAIGCGGAVGMAVCAIGGGFFDWRTHG